MTGSDIRLGDWLDAVADRSATPGGGAVAAVALAAAAALGAMVARFSVGVIGDADSLASQADAVRRHALELEAADEAVVSALYPGAAGGAGARQGRAAQEAARRAAEVPLEIVQAAAALTPVLRRLRGDGNQRLAGDAQVALELAEASARAAAALVRIDVHSLGAPERATVLSSLSAAETALRAAR